MQNYNYMNRWYGYPRPYYYGMYKRAAQPPMGDPAMMGGAPPMGDPSMMGGAPPMGDPAMMGGAPPMGDPAMMGGAPPMGDPAMMGGMPPMGDPAMMGGMPPAAPPPGDPAAGGAPPIDPAADPAAPGAKKNKKQDIDDRLDRIETAIYNLNVMEAANMKAQGTPVPVEAFIIPPGGAGANISNPMPKMIDIGGAAPQESGGEGSPIGPEGGAPEGAELPLGGEMPKTGSLKDIIFGPTLLSIIGY